MIICKNDSNTIIFAKNYIKMQNLQVNIQMNSELYLKNPDTSELGKKIVASGIDLISELGFEAFTFKKLGAKIGSNESSIYRYFESKHTFLIYLTSWYWSWIEYKIVFATINIDNKKRKLEEALNILTQPIIEDRLFQHINEIKLGEIIITESSKAYHTIDVDSENEKGYFEAYKQVVQRISNMVLDLNPKFDYPHMLISTVIEGVHQQRYFAQHIPALTDIHQKKDNIKNFYRLLVFNAIK